MTIYILQMPYRRPAKIWTAGSEQEALSLLADVHGQAFDDLLEAARYDMRDAYVTGDVFDLYLFCSIDPNAQATGAHRAFFADASIQLDVKDAATTQDDDEVVWTAFDGQFFWSQDDEEWRLGNQPAVAADDMVHALCEASLALALRDRSEHHDG